MNMTDLELEVVSGGEPNYTGCDTGTGYGMHTWQQCHGQTMNQMIGDIVANVRNIVYGPGK